MDTACVALGLAWASPAGEQVEVAVVRFQGHSILDVWCSQPQLDWSPIANPLTDRIGDSTVIGYNVSNIIEELRRQGFYLPNLTLDLAELAAILLPQESPSTPTASSVEPGARGQALAAQQRYVALLEHASAFDRPLIEEMARLAQVASPSLAVFFREVLRAKASLAFGNQKAAQGGMEGIVANRALAERTPLAPLKPKADVRLLDKEALSAALQPEGIVAKSLAGYEHREPQLRMLEAVVDAFNEQHHLIVEAGTGTGKSLAYLLPAMMFATQNDERVVISTNTINLQDQLFQKDIPSLQRLLPSTGEVALLKGRGNYLCLWQFAARRQRPGLSQEEAQPLLKLLAWLPQTSAGDANEMALSSKERAFWPRVAATEENCIGSVCPFFRQNLCYLFRGRKQAEAAHIIVVNHALLLSDLVSGNKVLPEYRYLVIDEAHRLEEEATEQLSYSVEQTEIRRYMGELTEGFLGRLTARLRGSSASLELVQDVHASIEAVQSTAQESIAEAEALFQLLAAFLRTHSTREGEYGWRLRLTPATRSQPAWSEIDIIADRFVHRLTELQRQLSQLYSLWALFSDFEGKDADESLNQIEWHLRSIQQLWERIDAMVSSPRSEEVYWLSQAPQGNLALHAAPLRVGEILRRELFDAKECVVLTSATLAVGGNFDHIREQLGLQEAAELCLPSPFDYRASCLIYLPQAMPNPEQPGYQKAVEEAITSAVRASQGKALALFTSRSHLVETYAAIQGPLTAEGFTVLGQGVDSASRQHLLQALRSTPRTVLLGTSSFWEGVDVVGEALSVLIIVRLPFSVPTEPVFAARSELYEEPFTQFALPQAVLRFKQGFGRLIRSQRDHGVFIALDGRLQQRAYGRIFLASLPPAAIRSSPLSTLPAVVSTWLSAPQA